MAIADEPVKELLRCPVCLALHAVPEDLSPEQRVRCQACSRPFVIKNGIPGKKLEDVTWEDEKPKELEREIPRLTTENYLFAMSLTLLWVGAATWYSYPMSGPEFLLFYVIIFLFTWLGSLALRSALAQYGQLVTVVGLLVFESVGAARIATGLFRDMHKFGFLVLMMIMGGFFFFIRFLPSSGPAAAGTCNLLTTCSGSSGCGGGCGSSCGGGCGGGGCGGCSG